MTNGYWVRIINALFYDFFFVVQLFLLYLRYQREMIGEQTICKFLNENVLTFVNEIERMRGTRVLCIMICLLIGINIRYKLRKVYFSIFFSNIGHWFSNLRKISDIFSIIISFWLSIDTIYHPNLIILNFISKICNILIMCSTSKL